VPAKSKKQERFMQAVANNPKFAKKVGIPQLVGKEFTKVKKYNPGGKVITPKKEKARIKELAKQDRYKKILERDIKIFGPNEESKPAKDVDISTRKGFKELINKPVKKRAGGLAKAAVKAVKKFLPKKKETNPFRSTVGDSYADRAKKQGEIEEFIRRDNSIYRTKKAKERGLKTLSERMKRERKETRDIKIFGKKKGGMVKRGDGCAVKGKTKGRMV
jgi:hypothetical protein